MRMVVTSLYVNAYFKRLRRIKQSGRHSRDLCGPTRVVKKTRATHIVSQSFIRRRRRRRRRRGFSGASHRSHPARAMMITKPSFRPRGRPASIVVVVVVVVDRRFATRTGGRLRREHTAELIEHPMLGRIESLKVFLEPSSHDRFLRGGELRGRACGARARSCASVRPSVRLRPRARPRVPNVRTFCVYNNTYTVQCLFF